MTLSMVVVFPAPFRPTRQTASAAFTASESPCRMWAGPRKVFRRSTTSIAESPGRPGLDIYSPGC